MRDERKQPSEELDLLMNRIDWHVAILMKKTVDHLDRGSLIFYRYLYVDSLVTDGNILLVDCVNINLFAIDR
jgi:hypothetical protein